MIYIDGILYLIYIYSLRGGKQMKNRVKTKWLVMLFSVAMAACLMVVPSFAAEIVDSGTCGDNLTWELDSDGVLTISGSGNMTDWEINDGYTTAPWFDYSEEIKEVIIENGVTSIGDDAFWWYCENLESVSIPDSVTSIGINAFCHCISLESIDLPDSLTSIGISAFRYCESLKSITIPEGITRLETLLFGSCDSLESVTLPESLESIGSWVFEFDPNLKSLNIPDSVTSLDDGAFANCGLECIVIGDGVQVLTEDAFAGCGNLTSITLGSGLTSIEEGAFDGCDALESITIPENVSSIEDDAFKECTALETVIFKGNAPVFGENAFEDVAATIYYPADDDTWTEEILQDYGGSITWVAYDYLYGYASCSQDDTCLISKFVDLDETAWYHDGVHFCIENDLMNGTSNTTFEPSTATTRSMIVTMLYRLAGEPDVTGTSSFTDVVSGSWYEDAVIWAEQNGIANGYGTGEFGVSDEVTREQIAAFFCRYAEYAGEDVTESADLSSYPDADEVSDWAEAELSWAVAKGLITGQGSGSATYLASGSDAMRSETATILMRFIINIIDVE